MSNIATISNDTIYNNLAKASVVKKNTLANDEVQNGLGKVEMRVAKAGTKKPIKLLTDEELTEKVSDSIEFIARDLGIKNFRLDDDNNDDVAYETSRFCQLIRNYYDDLSFEEIRIAFELSMVGNLDEWLPDGHGHYQSFSFEYVTKVLNAYREYKGKTWSKANKLIPYNPVITDDQKEENKKFFIQDIVNKFRKYRDEKQVPQFLVPFLVIDELVARGLTSGARDLSEEDKKRGFVEVMSRNFKSPLERAKIAKDTEQGIENSSVNVSAERYAQQKEIVRVFDEIISSGMDIEDLITV